MGSPAPAFTIARMSIRQCGPSFDDGLQIGPFYTRTVLGQSYGERRGDLAGTTSECLYNSLNKSSLR